MASGPQVIMFASRREAEATGTFDADGHVLVARAIADRGRARRRTLDALFHPHLGTHGGRGLLS